MGSFRVVTSGQPLVITSVTAKDSGTTVPLFTDIGLTVSVAIPLALSTDTTLFLSDGWACDINVGVTQGNGANIGPYVVHPTPSYSPSIAPRSTSLQDVDTVATPLPSRLGNRWVALGDSTTLGSVDNTFNSYGDAWPVYASILSQQRLHLVRNAGVAGNQTSQMIARFSTDVTPYAPRIVTILAGTNDYANSIPFSTFQTNIKTLVGLCLSIGAQPVLATMLPRDAGGFQSTIVLWNAWIRRYADTQGIPVLDFYRQMVDPTNGHYLSAYFFDGVHPTGAGHALLGFMAANTLSYLVSTGAPLLPQDQVDTNNLLPNPLFIAGGPIPTSWTPGSAPSGVTKSLVVDSAVPGNLFTAVCAASSGIYVLQLAAPLTTGFSVNDTLALTGVCTSSGGVTATAKVTMTGSPGPAAATPMASLVGAFTRGVFYQEFKVIGGTSSLQVVLQAGAGTGTVQFGQMGLYNLTQMGIL